MPIRIDGPSVPPAVTTPSSPASGVDPSGSPAMESPVGLPVPQVPTLGAQSSFAEGATSTADLDGTIRRVHISKRAPIHSKETPTFEGAKLKPAVLETLYRGVTAGNFGSTTVQYPTVEGQMKSFQVHDMLYDLGNGKIGMRFIPVKDGDPAANQAMDAYLRQRMGLKPSDPIFTLVAYVHPEEHTGTLAEVGTKMVKTEMGNTHLGAYLGGGRTSNSPGGYHHDTWEVKHYPANVQVVSMADTDQATLNRSLLAADAVLNRGVKFPENFKNDPFRTVDLNTTLMFYRDWLNGERYLRDDNSWRTYCAEHKTIVTNVGLNLPHNPEAFNETFGAVEGPELWKKFKEQFEKATGRAFRPEDESRFQPLWKKEGLKPEQIRPPTKAQYDAYQAARFDGTLRSGAYHGYEPLPIGRSLAWTPESTADLVKNFVETYAPFREVGGIISATSILAFKQTVMERMGVSEEVFQKLSVPLLQEILAAEALARAPANDLGALTAWTQKTTAIAYVALGGKKEDLAPGGTVDAAKMGLARALMGKVPTVQNLLLKLADKTPQQRNDYATGWVRKAIQDELNEARGQMVSDPGRTERYSPPAVTNRVVNGLVDSNRYVKIETVATAVDEGEVER